MDLITCLKGSLAVQIIKRGVRLELDCILSSSPHILDLTFLVFSGILLLDLVQAWAWVPSLSFFKTTNLFLSGYFHLTSKSYAKVHHFYLLVWLDLKSVLFHNQKLRSSFSFLVLKVIKSFYLSASIRLHFLIVFYWLTL